MSATYISLVRAGSFQEAINYAKTQDIQLAGDAQAFLDQLIAAQFQLTHTNTRATRKELSDAQANLNQSLKNV